MSTVQEDILKKLKTKEIRKRKHAKKQLEEGTIVTTNTLNILEHEEEYTSLSSTKDKKMKKKKKVSEEKTEITKLSNKVVNEKRKNTCDDIDTAHSKIYKCEVCEKLCKSSSSLNKHKAKVHILNEDAVKTTYISKHLGDEINTLISNTKDKKMKKKKKVSEENTEITKLSSNKVVNEKQKSTSDYIDTAHSKIYKCEVCEKLCKSYFSLNKHKAKAHILNKDAIIRNYISKHLGDEENTLILKKEVKKMKEKKAYKKRNRVKQLSSNEAMTYTQQIKCEDLSQVYLENDIDSVHTKEACNSKTYKCEVCEKSCKSDSALNKHKAKVHKFNKDADADDEVYTLLLNTLDKKIKKKKKASKEKIQVDNEVIYHNQKRICNDIDMKMINNNRSYECEYCEKSCKSNSSLDKHKAKAHILKKEADFILTNISKCTEDNKVHTSLLNTQVKKNKKIRAKVRVDTVTVKEKTISDEPKDVSDSVFNTIVHTNVSQIDKFYECSICRKSFEFLSALDEHKTNCHFTYVNPCISKFCDNPSEKANSLSVQKCIGTGKSSFECELCNKTYSTRSGLRNHYKEHSGKKHTCDVCDRKFTHKGTLTVHYRQHTGERPFACDVCGNTFLEKGTLTTHYRIHTREKPYKCGLCDMSFTTSSNRSKHMRIKHDNCI